MIDQALMDVIRAHLEAHPSIKELPSNAAQALIHQLAERYRRSATTRWWWQGNDGAETIHYGGSPIAPMILARVPAETGARLVITDDEFPPWPVLSGTVGDLLELIDEQRYFELMLTAEDGAWVIFDTHHNELVFLGDIRREPATP